jgi:single-strand DNA-binding protein
MVNKVILIGRLVADPEVRAAANGTQVANVRLATNTFTGREEDGTRREVTEFHSLVLFSSNAQFASNYMRKGALVYAEGRSQTRSWETEEGQKRYTTEVVVDRFQSLQPKASDAAG